MKVTLVNAHHKVLSKAIEGDSRESRHLVGEVLLQRARKHLEESQRIALLRSGARGKAARADEIASEQAVDELQQRSVIYRSIFHGGLTRSELRKCQFKTLMTKLELCW